jgi:ribonuclease HI
MRMTTTLYVDGGCTGNRLPNIAARQMVMVVADDAGEVLSERHSTGGSNNIAELEAVCDALAWCVENGRTDVQILTDSRNNLAWVFGSKVGRKINDRPRVLSLLRAIDRYRHSIALTMAWVPREENLAGLYLDERGAA